MKRSLIATAAAVLVTSLVAANPVHAKDGPISVAPTEVKQGEPVEYRAQISTKSKTCTIGLTDTLKVDLGKVTVRKGVVTSSIDTTILPAGSYRVVLRCGKEKGRVSSSFTINGSVFDGSPAPAAPPAVPPAPVAPPPPPPVSTNASRFAATIVQLFQGSSSPYTLCTGLATPLLYSTIQRLYDTAARLGVTNYGLDYASARAIAIGVYQSQCAAYGISIIAV